MKACIDSQFGYFLHSRQSLHLFCSFCNELSDSYLFGFLSQEYSYQVLILNMITTPISSVSIVGFEQVNDSGAIFQ